MEKTMSMRNLIPWRRNGVSTDTSKSIDQNPFLTLHREMNRLFDETFRSFDLLGHTIPGSSMTMGWPEIEIAENDKQVTVSAEVPGLEEKDVDVVLEDDVLILRGEKRSEIDDKDRQFTERYYGQFERRIPLGVEVEEDKVSAAFKNGVLTVTLPKSASARSRTKRIPINGNALN
jgi:HSP20 family protein